MLSTLLSLLEIFANNIAPILIIVSVGYVFGKIQKLETVQLGRVVFYIFSPALMFRVMTNSTIDHAIFVSFALTVVLVFVAVLVISVVLFRVLRLSDSVQPNLILAAVSPNMGNYGLPLVELAFGAVALTYAALVLVIGTIIYNIVGVFVGGKGDNTLRRLGGVLQVPLLYTGLLGIAFNWFGIFVPKIVDVPVTLMADAAIPAMLVLLGMQLSKITHLINLRILFFGSFIRLIFAGLVALGVSMLFGLEYEARAALIVQASMPVAVMTTIISTTYDMDSDLAASLVLVTTLLSPITLSVIILLLQG